MTSAEDDSAARTTVPTEARTATHGPLEALVPQRAISIPPLSFPLGLHNLPLGGASNGADVLAGAKLCDSLVI